MLVPATSMEIEWGSVFSNDNLIHSRKILVTDVKANKALLMKYIGGIFLPFSVQVDLRAGWSPAGSPFILIMNEQK